MELSYQLPSRIASFLRRLDIFYRQDHKRALLSEIVRTAAVYVEPNVSYDGWGNGMTGHGVIFYVEEETLEKIPTFEVQDSFAERLREDLNKASASISDEKVEWVTIELFDPNEIAQKPLTHLSKQPIINPDKLTIWKEGQIRLFVSHRDQYKGQVSALAETLDEFGISSFVAHANIEPMEEWEVVIRQGLQTMEVMLLFITDDFFDSVWTNQEIGVALDRGVPIISLKLQGADPAGFVAKTQALKGDLDNIEKSTIDVYRILAEKLGQKERLRVALVQAFVDSPDFDAAKLRFGRLKSLETLTESDAQRIVAGFAENGSLYGAYYLINGHRRLLNFLENRTGKKFEIIDRKIVEQDSNLPELDDEMPF